MDGWIAPANNDGGVARSCPTTTCAYREVLIGFEMTLMMTYFVHLKVEEMMK